MRMNGFGELGQRPLDDTDALERARLSRDPRFDGKFFIAVTSTRVYCRPICPVRSPRPDHIRYYPTAAAAAEAGFRPCLRCRPEAAPGTPAWLGTSVVVRRALRLIDDGVLDEGSVEALAARCGIGSRHLRRLFIQHVGASPMAVAQTRRLHFAKRLLDETTLPVTKIGLAAGFGSIRRFNAAFHATYHRAPRDLRRQRRGGVPAEADEVALRLSYRPPYDWGQVSEFLAARAVPGVERADARGYARTVSCDSGHAVVRISPIEVAHALELRVSGAPASMLFQLSFVARRVFDLGADPERIERALRSDALLGPLVRRRPGLRIPGVWDPFECAVRAVVGQQITVAGARTITARLVERAGRRVSPGADGLTHLFPAAVELASADLDGLGLTQARAAALRELARAAASGRLDFGAPAGEVAAALTALPGLGEWTAQYVALRGLGDPDAFPAADVVLRSMAAGSGGAPTARALEARAEAWRPWRGYAALHLWRAAGERAKADRSRPKAAAAEAATDAGSRV